ncbi:DUF4381 domain-containing protein [Vibrio gallaecicus]|uniref:DUF4381 domain-containing protein n=1 Tax=Vibrio gallaecicus TaxID=552386 RepID=UPI0010C9755C|nr:DUF4381 domain-containing protein [Vibrio gallaecicus]MDN3614658.1 DUF4381 domain-containing protein [Vibrio gallaecicus]MDN3615911.1 DUF4381 domain-containing protein [Vibrio gallaecicus]MDN3615936.1 DUF4381 domain-containing protein [Vibrio gallaecicus]
MPSNNILLTNFVDPELPISIAFYPQTFGWKVLFVVIGLGLAGLGIRFIKKYKEERYRKKALSFVQQRDELWAQACFTGDAATELRSLNNVLKNTACYAFPNHNIAHLTGKEWLRFLSITSQDSLFVSEVHEHWQKSIYRPNSARVWTSTELTQVKSDAIEWIKCHKRDAAYGV